MNVRSIIALLFSLTSIPLVLAQSAPEPQTYSLSVSDLGALQAPAPNPNGGTFPAGTLASDIFTVGDLDDLGLPDLSFNDINPSLATAAITDVPVISDLTPVEITEAIPGLADLAITDVAPFESIASVQGILDAETFTTVGEIAPLIEGTLGQNAAAIPGAIIGDLPGLAGFTHRGDSGSAIVSRLSDTRAR